jgi:hypothetical protein
MDEKVQEALFSDLRVAKSLKKAGDSALSDPEVQKAILATCKDRFPEHAGYAATQVKAWAKDPVVQARAKDSAKVAIGYARQAGHDFMKRIEQGPAGVRVLAFVGSLASFVIGCMSFFNVFSIFHHPVLYTVSAYQMVFSLTTIIFEAQPEWIEAIQDKCPALQVDNYQNMLLENAKFLSLNGGRGMFYVFQGTMWLAFASLTDLPNLAIGLYMAFIGILHVLMHFEVMPQIVAEKMRAGYEAVKREAHGSQYQPVKGDPQEP